MIKSLTHIGDGEFEVLINDGSIKTAGTNICGMIRYTYFEDYTLPPVGWSIDHEQLMKDYHVKVTPEILSGKIKPTKHEF